MAKPPSTLPSQRHNMKECSWESKEEEREELGEGPYQAEDMGAKFVVPSGFMVEIMMTALPQ